MQRGRVVGQEAGIGTVEDEAARLLTGADSAGGDPPTG